MPLFLLLLFCGLLVTAGIFDFRTQKIPDWIPAALLVTGFLHVIAIPISPPYISLPDLENAFLGLLVGGLPLLIMALIKKQSIGGGDIKLAASAGFVLGFDGASVALLLALIALLIFSQIYIRIKRLPHHTAFPFAPFYAIAGITISILITVSIFANTHSVRFI